MTETLKQHPHTEKPFADPFEALLAKPLDDKAVVAPAPVADTTEIDKLKKKVSKLEKQLKARNDELASMSQEMDAMRLRYYGGPRKDMSPNDFMPVYWQETAQQTYKYEQPSPPPPQHVCPFCGDPRCPMSYF